MKENSFWEKISRRKTPDRLRLSVFRLADEILRAKRHAKPASKEKTNWIEITRRAWMRLALGSAVTAALGMIWLKFTLESKSVLKTEQDLKTARSFGPEFALFDLTMVEESEVLDQFAILRDLPILKEWT